MGGLPFLTSPAGESRREGGPGRAQGACSREPRTDLLRPARVDADKGRRDRVLRGGNGGRREVARPAGSVTPGLANPRT